MNQFCETLSPLLFIQVNPIPWIPNTSTNSCYTEAIHFYALHSLAATVTMSKRRSLFIPSSCSSGSLTTQTALKLFFTPQVRLPHVVSEEEHVVGGWMTPMALCGWCTTQSHLFHGVFCRLVKMPQRSS